jgi:hypothetical protein
MRDTILFYSKISILITLFACIDMLIFNNRPSVYNYLFFSMLVALKIFTYYNSIILFFAGAYLLFKKATIKFGIISMVIVIIFFIMSTLFTFKLFS